MTKEDKIIMAEEAMYLLEQAQDLLEQLEDGAIDGYAVGHINAKGTYMGEGVYQVVENYIKNQK